MMSPNTCRVCAEPIMQMCRKGTGICGEICQKVIDSKRGSRRLIPKKLKAKGSEDLANSRG